MLQGYQFFVDVLDINMHAQYGRAVLEVVHLEAVEAYQKQAEREAQSETKAMLKAQTKEKRVANTLKKSNWILLKNSKNFIDSEQQKTATI